MGKKRQKREKPTQLLMLGITVEAPRPERFEESVLFDGHEVRMHHIDGVTWFVAADICKVLGIDNPRQAVSRLDDDERMTVTTNDGHSERGRGGAQSLNVVSESGLYSLIFTSRKSEAKRFKRWVTHEVLPAIRRYGCYSGRDPRHHKIKRRLNCDDATAEVRLKVVGENKAFQGVLAKHDAKPVHFQRAYNSVYRALYEDMTAPELRKALGIRKSATPLDHMSRFALSLQLMMVALAEKLLEDRKADGNPVPLEQQPAFIKANVEKAKVSFLAVLGPGEQLNVTNDPKRGLLIGVVRKQLPPGPSSPGEDSDSNAA